MLQYHHLKVFNLNFYISNYYSIYVQPIKMSIEPTMISWLLANTNNKVKDVCEGFTIKQLSKITHVFAVKCKPSNIEQKHSSLEV